jgi:hypothetical protein
MMKILTMKMIILQVETPPDDEGGDPDDEPDHNEDDGLNAQDRVFMRLSEAINNLACNN